MIPSFRRRYLRSYKKPYSWN